MTASIHLVDSLLNKQINRWCFSAPQFLWCLGDFVLHVLTKNCPVIQKDHQMAWPKLPQGHGHVKHPWQLVKITTIIPISVKHFSCFLVEWCLIGRQSSRILIIKSASSFRVIQDSIYTAPCYTHCDGIMVDPDPHWFTPFDGKPSSVYGKTNSGLRWFKFVNTDLPVVASNKQQQPTSCKLFWVKSRVTAKPNDGNDEWGSPALT